MTLTKPDDIPENVWETARLFALTPSRFHPYKDRQNYLIDLVSRAFMAERERTAKVVGAKSKYYARAGRGPVTDLVITALDEAAATILRGEV